MWMTNMLLVRRKINIPPKLSIIYERYWIQNLAPTIEQHIELPPKTSNANLSRKIYMLGIWYFYMLFWPTWQWAPPYTNRHVFIHVDRHLVDRKPSKILGGDPFRVSWACKGKIADKKFLTYLSNQRGGGGTKDDDFFSLFLECRRRKAT
jgi:hypothetical protein